MKLATTKDRIVQYIDYKGIKRKDFFLQTDIKRGFLDADKLKGSVSDVFVAKIIAKYTDINPLWLLTGEGDMLLDENVKSESATANKIPLYSGVTIGGASAVANTTENEQIEEYIDAGDWFRDATAAMRVHGDSMHPTYKSGSIVALKKVEDKSLILYGQDYVLETSEYRVIKRLQKSDDKEYWRCCSANQETYEKTEALIHEPFDVPIDAVSKLFRVLGCVTRTESSRIVLNGTV